MGKASNSSFDKKVQKRIEWIKKQAGDEIIEALKKHGANVDKALKRIVTEQVKKEEQQRQEKRALALEGTPLVDCMTSELVILHKQTNDKAYQKELQKRFDLLGLTDKQQRNFIESEKERAKSRSFPSLYPSGLARHYFLMDGVGIEDLPKPEQCLTSELIALTDDADAAWAKDHHWLKEKTMNAVGKIVGVDGKPLYYKEYERRTEKWGWTRLQQHSFTKNEGLILGRAKWRYHSDPSWEKETMLSQKQLEEDDREREEAKKFWESFKKKNGA